MIEEHKDGPKIKRVYHDSWRKQEQQEAGYQTQSIHNTKAS